MSGGPWVAYLMLGGAPLLLLFARIHDPKHWRLFWVNAWVIVSYGLEWLRCRLVPAVAAGAVIVAWQVRPAIERLAVMVQRRTVRQAR